MPYRGRSASQWMKLLGGALAALAASLVALLLALALAVPLLDWNSAKPWLGRQLSAALGRDIRVDGNLDLSWSLAQADDEAGALARLLPQLRLRAERLFIGNPDWAHSSDHLVRAAAVDVRFSPLPLLRWHWHVTDLRVDGLDLVMERADDQRKNWRFSSQPRSRWSFDIHRIVFGHALIRYVDLPLDLDLRFDARPLNATATNQKDSAALVLQAAVTGRYGQAEVNGQIKGGALPDLLNEGSVFPLQAEGDIGGVQTQLSGNLINPHQLSRADLRLRLAGDSLDRLYPATGVPLPATRAFRTEGALTITRLDPQTKAWDWRYSGFSGKVGDSDFAGDAQYVRGPPKNHLKVKAEAGLLRLSDYLPGDDADQGKPSKPAQPERWSKLDADIDLQAKRVQWRAGLEWQQAAATLTLKDQVLTADPLRFKMAGGQGQGQVRLDGSQPEIRSRLQIRLQDAQVRELFPRLASLKASFSKLNGEATLSATGNSAAAVLASADGEIKADLGPGAISQFILEAAGLNLANAVFAKLYRDQQVKLLCGAADVTIQRGLATIRHGILNTEDAAIDVGGQVDLGRQTLALDIHPRTKQVRILSLRTPLHVRGSFSHPEIGADSGALAARAGAAAALALVAPVAAVIPLISPGQAAPDDCVARSR